MLPPPHEDVPKIDREWKLFCFVFFSVFELVDEMTSPPIDLLVPELQS